MALFVPAVGVMNDTLVLMSWSWIVDVAVDHDVLVLVRFVTSIATFEVLERSRKLVEELLRGDFLSLERTFLHTSS